MDKYFGVTFAVAPRKLQLLSEVAGRLQLLNELAVRREMAGNACNVLHQI